MRFPSPLRRPAARQAGASLLEVLVSVLILAIGLLGIAALQSISLRNTQSASERTAAVIQSYAMLDMMRANRNAARAGQYNQGYRCEAPEDPSASRVEGDWDRWIAQLQDSMGPTACGAVDCGANDCEISVRWNESGGVNRGDQLEITTRTRL